MNGLIYQGKTKHHRTKMKSGLAALFVFAWAISGVVAQEHGIVMTVYSFWYWDIVKHLPKFPYYENVTDVEAAGLSFNDYNIELTSVDMDYRTGIAYSYDDYYRSLFYLTGYNNDLEVSQMEFDAMHLGVSKGESVQLKVDWQSHTVYWCDTALRWIVAAPGNPDKIHSNVYKILVYDHLDKPAGIAVDPDEGLLFWVDAGKHPKIEKSSLTGENRNLVTSKVKAPSHIEVDVYDKRIYWIQKLTNTLHSSDYTGTDIRRITNIVPYVALYDLAIFRDVVYLSDTYYYRLLTVDKNTGEQLNEYSMPTFRIFGISVYSEETQPMGDSDYCGDLDCEHLCITTTTGATCVCAEGFVYDSDTDSCQESNKGLHRKLMFANETDICVVDIRILTVRFGYPPDCLFSITNEDATNPSNDTTFIEMIELNMRDLEVYFARGSGTIYSRSLVRPIEDAVTVQIAKADGIITGLAYDPLDRLLYWSENSGRMYKVNVDTTRSDPVNLQDLPVNPSNLLLLQVSRKLAWITGEKGNMSIQTVNLDGTGLVDVVTGVDDIVSLTVNEENQMLYFIVPTFIYAYIYNVPIDGSENVTLFLSYLSETSHMLAYYNNYLIWTYNDSSEIKMYTYDISGNTPVSDGAFDGSAGIVDMKILDVKLQTTDRISPCSTDDGGCAQICITEYVDHQMTKKCECNLGYKLDADNMGCTTEAVSDNFILVAGWTYREILQIDLQTNEIHSIPANIYNLMGIYFDPVSQKVLWTNYLDMDVYSLNLDGSDSQVFAELETTHAYRFAADMTTGHIYYIGYSPSQIGVLTQSGKNHILIEDFDDEDLRDIEVYPEGGKLYFSAYVSGESYIARSNMDGTNVEKLIVGDLVRVPDGLAIDYNNKFLYWGDSLLDIVQRCDLDGQNCETILNITGARQQIVDIATDGQYLYYSLYRQAEVVRVDLADTTQMMKVGSHFAMGTLDTISFYSSANTNIQSDVNACAADGGLADCSTLCLPTASGRVCACEDGVKMRADERTCSNIPQCADAIMINRTSTSLTTKDVYVTFARDCYRRLGDQCEYECPRNYRPTNGSDVMLMCNEDGWDRESEPLCEEHRCPATILDGAIPPECNREVGDVCDFTCDGQFSKNEVKAYCKKDGTWHINDLPLCTRFQCTDEISQATGDNIAISLPGSCTRQIGTTCSYTCPENYAPANANTALTCTQTGWDRQSAELCKKIQCPQTIVDGYINPDCDRFIGHACEFNCNNGYTKSEEKTYCLTGGNWQETAAPFCSNTTAKVDKLEDTYKKDDVVIGIVIFVIAIVILLLVVAALLCYHFRNRGAPSREGKASYHKHGKEDNAYVSTSRAGSERGRSGASDTTSYIQPRLVHIPEESRSVQSGYTNPVYRHEPLPVVTHVDSDKHSYMSYSSWLNERGRHGY